MRRRSTFCKRASQQPASQCCAMRALSVPRAPSWTRVSSTASRSARPPHARAQGATSAFPSTCRGRIASFSASRGACRSGARLRPCSTRRRTCARTRSSKPRCAWSTRTRASSSAPTLTLQWQMWRCPRRRRMPQGLPSWCSASSACSGSRRRLERTGGPGRAAQATSRACQCSRATTTRRTRTSSSRRQALSAWSCARATACVPLKSPRRCCPWRAAAASAPTACALVRTR
mmetsp:Transcript_14791/g.39819  ORF Transcript_14791/g.39819 Transcript_14791/m.39819 type:complete len:232 (+) Transcript_14791:813-1508(+)